MISKVHYKNFKLLRDVELPLGRLNVIVGRNAIGKSTALEGLHLLLQLAVPRPSEDRHPLGRVGLVFDGPRSVDQLLSRPGPETLTLEVEDARQRCFGLEAGVTASSPGARFTLWYGRGDERSQLTLPADAKASRPRAEVKAFYQGPRDVGLGSVSRLRLDATTLARPFYTEAEHPRVEHDGEGLASVLSYLAGLRDGTLDAIEASLARLVHGAKRIRTVPARVTQTEKVRFALNDDEHITEQKRQLTGSRFELEMEGVGWLPAEQLSEGTLLAIGLLTILRHRPPRLILLDDLDKALHPVAQRETVRLLRQILQEEPELQVVAAAHSPFVLDELRPDEVFVAGATGPGASHIRRLDTHPSWERRKDYMQPGEFWSLVGEGWVAEGPA